MNSFTNQSLFVYKLGARLSFALTIIFIPFRWRLDIWSRPFFPLYSDYTDFHLFASDIALLFTLVFWLGSWILEPRDLQMGNRFISFCLIGLTLTGWVSVFFSVDTILSAYHATRFTFLFLFYLFIVNEIRSVRWIIVPVMIQVFLQSVIAIGQTLAQSSLGLGLFGEHTLDPAQSGVSIVPVAGMRFLRAYGLSDHPNILGGCLAFGLILLLAVVLYGKERQTWIASAGFLVVFPALVMTFSRSAWVSLMVAASFLVACEALARRWDSLKRAALLGMASLLLVSPFLIKNMGVFESRVNSGNVTQDDQMKERAFLLEAGNTVFVEHSAIGVGLGASALALKNRFEYFPLDYQPPHFALLTVAMEIGVFGALFYGLLWVVPGVKFFSHWQILKQQPRTLGALGLLLGVFVVGLFDYYTWSYAPGRLWQWLAWGLVSLELGEAA